MHNHNVRFQVSDDNLKVAGINIIITDSYVVLEAHKGGLKIPIARFNELVNSIQKSIRQYKEVEETLKNKLENLK